MPAVTPWPRRSAAPGLLARRDGGFADPPPALGAAVEATAGPDAETTLTTDDGRLTLSVPAGAVLEPVVIRLQRRAVPLPEDAAAVFGLPHAFFWVELSATAVADGRALHTFAVPLSLALRVPAGLLARLEREQGLLPEHLRWWQYDDDRARWLPQPAGYDPATGTLHVRLTHFSHGAAGADPNASPAAPPAMDAYGTDLFTGWPALAYPLPVPPGAGGMAPSLSLSYIGGTVDLTQHVPAPLPTTQAAWAGYGWTLEPGVIVRADNGVDFSLALEGHSSPLLLDKRATSTPTACASAAVEGCYHTDPERFAKIDHHWQAVALADAPASWTAVAQAGASGGTLKRSATAGDRIRFAFSGTSVIWYTTTGPDQGTAKVFVDGQLVKEEHNYAASVTSQVARTYSPPTTSCSLAPPNPCHELVIAVTGTQPAGASGALVTVDAFDGGAGRVEETAVAAGDWSAGWLADYWLVTGTDGTQYRFGYNLPAEIITPPSPPPTGPRTTTGSLEWMLLTPAPGGTQMVRQGTRYHLDQVTDPRGNRMTLTYDLAVADLRRGYASVVKADGPAGYWRLNETSGTTAVDSSGNGRHGTYVGSITNNVPGGPLAGDPQPVTQISSTSYDTGDYVSMGNVFDAPGAFTLEAWVYQTGTPNFNYGYVIAKGNSGWTGYALAVKSGKAQVRIRDELFELYGTTTLAQNTWYHLAATYDGTTARVYVNGRLEAAATPSVAPTSTGIPFQLGNGNANEDLEFIGRLAEAAYYPQALTDQQLLTHYQTGAISAVRGYARAAYLKQIDYTTHTSASPGSPAGQRKVVFSRDPRLSGATKDYETDGEYDARVGGGKAAETQRFFAEQRLTRVSTWICPGTCASADPPNAPWQEVARWDLTHEYLTTGTVTHTGEQYKNRLLLRTITPRSAGGSQSLPATTFDYDAANGGLVSRVANGYGGEVLYAYQTYNPAGNTGYTYRRVTTRTVKSGMINYAGTAQQTTEQYVTTHSYPSGSTLLGTTPGHPRVDAADGQGTLVHEFTATGDTTYPGRPGLRGTQTKTTARNLDGTAAGVSLQTWTLVRLATDPPANERQPVQLAAEERWSSDAATKQVSRAEYTYDGYGNPTQILERGDTSVAGDDRLTVRSFVTNTGGDTYLANLPSGETRYAGTTATASAAVQEVRYSYDGLAWSSAPTQGKLTRVEQFDAQVPATKEVAVYEYDAYGNRTRTTSLFDPATNNTSDARNPVTEVGYDTAYRTFPATTTARTRDLGGGGFATLVTSRTFDAGTGALLTVVDPNTATTRYEYDTFGRLTAVRRPGDESPAQATVTYEYVFGTAPNRVVVKERDGSADNAAHTIQFYDGLGRLVETKQELADNTNSAGQHSVVRRLYRDRGLLDTEYVPWGTPAQTSADFVAKFEAIESLSPAHPSTAYLYDGAGRLTRVTAPDGAVATTAYADPPFAGAGSARTLTDANGHQRREHRDGTGRLLRVEEPGAVTQVTRYRYDALGHLTQVRALGPFDTGTGADGALTLTSNTTWGDGTVKHFTDFTVPAGVTLTIQGTVTLFCTSTCRIDGTISGSGQAGAAGAGVPSAGGAGGNGDVDPTGGGGGGGGGHAGSGGNGGWGRGEGTGNYGPGGGAYGTVAGSPQPGAKGGNGGYGATGATGAGGGAGGAALDLGCGTLAGAGTVTVDGNGGGPGSDNDGASGGGGGGGGGGSGGQVRIRCATLAFTGGLRANGGGGGPGGPNSGNDGGGGGGAGGYVNVEYVTNANAGGATPTLSATGGGGGWSPSFSGGAGATGQTRLAAAPAAAVGTTGIQTDITYDGLGRKTRLVDPDAGQWDYTYDGLGRLVTQIDAKRQELRFTHDLASRLTQKEGRASSAAAWNTLATYTYDQGPNGLGRRTAMSDISGLSTGALAPSASWTYDNRRRVTQQTQTILGSTYTTSTTYDSLDRPVTVTYPTPDPEAVTTSYGAHGAPVALAGTATYASGATYSALFQPFGWTYGSGATAAFDYYDTADEPDRDGVAQPRDYRLRQVRYRAAPAQGSTVLQQHDYRYDRAGNVTRWWQQDQAGALRTWSYTYDERDRLLTATATNPPAGQPGSFSYSYNAAGNITAGPLGSYTYGDAAHKHAVTDVGGASSGTYRETVLADAPVAYWRLGETSGTTAADSSGNGHAGTLTGGVALDLPGALVGDADPAMGFGATGRYVAVPSAAALNPTRLTVEAWVKPATTSQLTGAAVVAKGTGGGGEVYALDVVNNRFRFYVWVGSSLYVANGTSALTTGWAHVVGTVDGTAVRLYVNGVQEASAAFSGNLASNSHELSLGARQSSGSAYDLPFNGTIDEVVVYNAALAAARIQAHYQAGTSAPTVAAPTHTYTYDANGAATERTENGTIYTHCHDLEGRQTAVVVGSVTCPLTSSANATEFIYNGDGQLVAKKVGGTVVAHYVAGGLYEKDPSTGATKKYYRFGGRLIAVRDSATGLHYLHQDHLGSTSLQTSSSGAYEGHAFRGPFGQPWVSSGSLATDLQYTGQRSLEGSLGSLYHYQARWYSPVLGRFLQPDTIVPDPANPQDLNRYSYVRNNPLVYTDPTGHAIGDRRMAEKLEDNGEWWYGQYVEQPWGEQFIPYTRLGDIASGEDREGTQQTCLDPGHLFCVRFEPVQVGPFSVWVPLPVKDVFPFGGDDAERAGAKAAVGEAKAVGSATRARYWTKQVRFHRNKVYQRDDLIDPRRVDSEGFTNLERMRQGRAPLGPDGEAIELHHMLQTADGPLAEVTATIHEVNRRALHINDQTVGSGINRESFKQWRKAYWRARALDFD